MSFQFYDALFLPCASHAPVSPFDFHYRGKLQQWWWKSASLSMRWQQGMQLIQIEQDFLKFTFFHPCSFLFIMVANWSNDDKKVHHSPWDEGWFWFSRFFKNLRILLQFSHPWPVDLDNKYCYNAMWGIPYTHLILVNSCLQ